MPTDTGKSQDRDGASRGGRGRVTTTKRIALPVLGALALGLTLSSPLLAQSPSQQHLPYGKPDESWTVLTMAPDGSWGAATETWVNQAIARAIDSCKAMSRAAIGCGAYLTTVQAGWSLGLTCGREVIVVADKTLAEAEQAARGRMLELRHRYVKDLPPCVRVVTVDPYGRITTPTGSHAAR